MTSRARRFLTQAGSFVLAGVLLYLALRGVDLSEVGDALRGGDYRWIPPLAAIVLLSHLLRAWRWQVLLEALPPDAPADPPRRVPLKLAFYSLMIGYMTNYAAPRLGEVVRTANLAARQKLSFSSVLGTVVVERILDVIVLALGLLGTLFLLLDRLHILHELFLRPVRGRLGSLSAPAWLTLAFVAGALFALLVWFAYRHKNSAAGRFWSRRVYPLLRSFNDGVRTVLRSPRRASLVVSTLAMWLCYLLMAYIPLLMFHMAAPYDLSLLDTWSIMILGAVGVAVPSPGGVGSFHYITIETLVHLFSVDQAQAATYAVFVHGGQMILYIAVGFVCILLQGSIPKVRRTLREIPRPEQHAAAGHARPAREPGEPPPTYEIPHGKTQP